MNGWSTLYCIFVSVLDLNCSYYHSSTAGMIFSSERINASVRFFFKLFAVRVPAVHHTFPQSSPLAGSNAYFEDFQVMVFPLMNVINFKNNNDCVCGIIEDFVSFHGQFRGNQHM